MNINIDEVEKFQEHFVKPMVEAVERKLDPLVTRLANAEAKIEANASCNTLLANEISKLKSNQAKALVGWTTLVSGVTLIVSLCFSQIKQWLNTHLFRS